MHVIDITEALADVNQAHYITSPDRDHSVVSLISEHNEAALKIRAFDLELDYLCRAVQTFSQGGNQNTLQSICIWNHLLHVE
jgi:hypothetical protein